MRWRKKARNGCKANIYYLIYYCWILNKFSVTFLPLDIKTFLVKNQESPIKKLITLSFFVSHTLCKSIAVGIKGSLWRCPLGQEGNIRVIIGILKLSPWHMRLLIFIRVHSRFEFQVGNSNWSLYTRDWNVCWGCPVHEVKCPCSRGREWGREMKTLWLKFGHIIFSDFKMPRLKS